MVVCECCVCVGGAGKAVVGWCYCVVLLLCVFVSVWGCDGGCQLGSVGVWWRVLPVCLSVLGKVKENQ